MHAVVSNYTQEFQENFLALLKQAHGQTRVSAKVGSADMATHPVLGQTGTTAQAMHDSLPPGLPQHQALCP